MLNDQNRSRFCLRCTAFLIFSAVATLIALPVSALPPGTLLGTSSGRLLAIDPATGDRTLVSGAGVGMGPNLSSRPLDVVIEPSGDFVVADFDLRALVRIEPGTGDRKILASETVGLGGAFRSGVVDRDQDGTLFVFNVESGAIERVDPVTGDRTPVSSPTLGTGPNLTAVQDLLYAGRVGPETESEGALLVVDSELDAVVEVALSDGDRTIFAGSGLDFGPDLSVPRGVARVAPAESFGGAAHVIDSDLGALVWSFDAIGMSGRFVVSSSTVGDGPGFVVPYSVWPTADGLGVYVTDIGLEALLHVDLQTGDRTIVSDATTGTGPVVGGLWNLTAIPIEQRLAWGFENIAPGGLPSWIDPAAGYSVGNLSVENPADFSGGVSPVEGDRLLYLTTGAGDRGEPTGADESGNGSLEFDESAVILAVPRGQNDPSTLRVIMKLVTSEAGIPDTVEVFSAQGIGTGSTEITPIAQFSTSVPNSPEFEVISSFSGDSITAPDGSVFTIGESDFRVIELEVDFPGVALGFRVRDEGDGAFDTGLLIDDIRYVPEPDGVPVLAMVLLATSISWSGLRRKKISELG